LAGPFSFPASEGRGFSPAVPTALKDKLLKVLGALRRAEARPSRASPGSSDAPVSTVIVALTVLAWQVGVSLRN